MFNLLECILDHQKTRDALSSDNEQLVSNENKRVQSDDGWYFQILCNDGNKEWVPLQEVKESNPIELAEYVRAKRLHEEPVFRHWVPTVLQQREAIVSKVKARIVTSHKYGVEIPRTVPQAHRLNVVQNLARKILDVRHRSNEPFMEERHLEEISATIFENV